MTRTSEGIIAFVFIILGLACTVYFYGTDMPLMSIIGVLLLIGGVILVAVNNAGWLRSVFSSGQRTENLKIRGTARERAFIRVQNTINNKKVFVSVEDDGIYIRLAGDENNGEAFNENKVKVYDYNV